MPKYRVLVWALESNTHEVIIESDRAFTEEEVKKLAEDAFFCRDLPEGVREKTRFNVDGENIEGPEFYHVEEMKE